MVVGDEVEQVYVDAGAPRLRPRRTCCSTRPSGRSRAAGHDVAWLAVVVGNERARRFYEKRGWVDGGDLPYEVTALGATYLSPVPPLRQDGPLTRSVLVEPAAEVGRDARAGDVLVARLLDPLAEHRLAALDRPVRRRTARVASAREVSPAARHSGQAEREVADDLAPTGAASSRRRPRSRRRRTRGPRPRTTAALATGSPLHSKSGTGSTSTQTIGEVEPGPAHRGDVASACW